MPRKKHKTTEDKSFTAVYQKVRDVLPGTVIILTDDKEQGKWYLTPYRTIQGDFLGIAYAGHGTVFGLVSGVAECITAVKKDPKTVWYSILESYGQWKGVREILKNFPAQEWLPGYDPRDEICPKCEEELLKYATFLFNEGRIVTGFLKRVAEEIERDAKAVKADLKGCIKAFGGI